MLMVLPLGTTTSVAKNNGENLVVGFKAQRENQDSICQSELR